MERIISDGETMEETEKIIVKEQPAAFPFAAIASEKQFFLTNCRMARKRIELVAGFFRDEDAEVYDEARKVACDITHLMDMISGWYAKHPQANYDDHENEGPNGKTTDLTRIYTFCLSLESYADEYEELCPEVTQHCYLAMASLIDAVNAIAAFYGREGEPEGLNTLGAYLGFAAFISDPERLRDIAAGIAQNVLEKK